MIELRRRTWTGRICYSPKLFMKHLSIGKGVVPFHYRFYIAARMTRNFIWGY